MHRLLKRQLSRIYGKGFSLDGMSEKERQLIDEVEKSYVENDQERRLLEHTLDLSSQELNQKNKETLRTLSELLESRERLWLAKQSARLGIWDYDITHNTLTWDARMREIWGIGAEEAVCHKDWIDGIHPEDRPAIDDVVSKILDPGGDGFFRLEYRVIGRDTRREHWVMASGRALFVEKQPVRMLGTILDITEEKHLQEALRQAKQAAESANRAKSAFLANMSHELRTPLNAMLGHAQILQRDTELNHKQRRSLETIQRSGDHLITLINDILDLAKIEAGRLDLTPAPCDLHALFRGQEELFRMRAQDKGIGFRYLETTPLPALVEADEKRLRQITMNLLGNAVKFTEAGEVCLEAGYADGRLALTVIDSGIGIHPERIAGLFQPFQQEGTEEYRNQGTGLGLAIVRQLVEQMGGTI